jgi:hypothetical protein
MGQPVPVPARPERRGECDAIRPYSVCRAPASPVSPHRRRRPPGRPPPGGGVPGVPESMVPRRGAGGAGRVGDRLGAPRGAVPARAVLGVSSRGGGGPPREARCAHRRPPAGLRRAARRRRGHRHGAPGPPLGRVHPEPQVRRAPNRPADAAGFGNAPSESLLRPDDDGPRPGFRGLRPAPPAGCCAGSQGTERAR